MLAQKDDTIKEASNTIYQLSQEGKIRLQCEAREDYYRRECRMARQHEEINDLEARIAKNREGRADSGRAGHCFQEGRTDSRSHSRTGTYEAKEISKRQKNPWLV